eukprot:15328732-Ditylum_brightwellii.AAC.1
MSDHSLSPSASFIIGLCGGDRGWGLEEDTSETIARWKFSQMHRKKTSTGNPKILPHIQDDKLT